MAGRAQELNLLHKRGLWGVLEVSVAVLVLPSLLRELSHTVPPLNLLNLLKGRAAELWWRVRPVY